VKRLVLGAALAALALLAAGWKSLLPPSIPVPAVRDREIAPVTVLNPRKPPLPNRRLVITGGRIASLEEARAGRAGEERFVTPGLIDMHAHLPPWYAPGQRDLFLALFLLHGVTSMRDAGSLDGRTFALAREIAAGEVAGPRVFGCGRWLDGDPKAWPMARSVRDSTEAIAQVAALSHEAVCVKALSGVSPSVRDALREAAHRRGLSLIGHLPLQSPFAEWRLDEIEHVCDPHCWRLGPSERDELVRTAREHRIAHTPTLVVYDRQLAMYAGDPRVTPAVALLPRVWSEVIWNRRYRLGFDMPPVDPRQSQRRAHEAMFEMIQETVSALHRAGVPIYAGSDVLNPMVVPGDGLQRELALLVGSGLTNDEAWRAATSLPAQQFGIEGLGTIAVGAPADLLIFSRNPVDDLGALSSLEAVIVGGRYYDVPELRRGIDAQLEHFARWPYDWLSMGVTRAILESIARGAGDE